MSSKPFCELNFCWWKKKNFKTLFLAAESFQALMDLARISMLFENNSAELSPRVECSMAGKQKGGISFNGSPFLGNSHKKFEAF